MTQFEQQSNDNRKKQKKNYLAKDHFLYSGVGKEHYVYSPEDGINLFARVEGRQSLPVIHDNSNVLGWNNKI